MRRERAALKVKRVDLRALVRTSSKTTVNIETGSDLGPSEHEWIVCGDASLTASQKRGGRPWILSAHLSKEAMLKTTPKEIVEKIGFHDFTCVLHLMLTGLEILFVSGGCTCITAWVGGEPEDFKVPERTFDMRKKEDVDGLKRFLRDEDEPKSVQRWAKFVGRKVTITISNQEVT